MASPVHRRSTGSGTSPRGRLSSPIAISATITVSMRLDISTRALPDTLRDTSATEGMGVGLIIAGETRGFQWAVREGETWNLCSKAPRHRRTSVTLEPDVP